MLEKEHAEILKKNQSVIKQHRIKYHQWKEQTE